MICEFLVSTHNGHQKVRLLFDEFKADRLNKYQDQMVEQACKNGCINYAQKWSCPPFAEKYSSLVKSYECVGIFCLSIELKDMDYISNPYLKVRAANSILKSKLINICGHCEVIFNGVALLSGSCNRCKPCACKKGLPCSKPSQKRYSIEATGVNVEKMAEELMGYRLLWYKKGYLPAYTSVVGCVLFNKTESMNYQQIVHSYIQTSTSLLSFDK